MSKVIVTAAITGGVHTPSMTPYLPITPQQIADEAVRVCEAGASVAHIHVRDPETGKPCSETELFSEVVAMVKKRCDIVLCLTTGGPKRATVDERVRVVSTFEPELASLNTGSLNFALFPMAEGGWEFEYDWEKQYLEDSEDYIFVNTFKTLREFLHIFGKAQTKPELEIYDAGMIDNVVYLLERGLLKRPIYLQFVLGILGGMAATPNNLMFLYSRARETIGDFTWSVCAAGRHQIPLCTTALVLGGNVRVGLEDSMYVGRGVLATSNADQVEKIIRIARELSLEPATPSDAREMLGLKGLDQVNW